VKTTEFVTPEGLGDYRKTAEVRREVFAPPFPAATGVVCEGLPAPGAQIAVEAVAVRAPR
jgi:enamine deaminase RidA (YjgF/YER057c/UK114 family)